MELLSKILSETKLQSSVICELVMRYGGAVSFEIGSGSPAHFVVSGRCELQVQSGPPVSLTAGDFVMLPRWLEHRLTPDLECDAVPIRDLVRQTAQPVWTPGSLLDRPIWLDVGEGEVTCKVISIAFRVENPNKSPLIRSLPDCMHLSHLGAASRALLEAVLEFVGDRENAASPGYAIASNRLADLVFTQMIREQVSSRPDQLSGLLLGLVDPALALLLPDLHLNPRGPWSIETMARTAGLSRTIFAQRFKSKMGETPHAYLTELRMMRAASMLLSGKRIKEVAGEVGYRTNLAFVSAFKRTFDCAPNQYRKLQSGVDGPPAS